VTGVAAGWETMLGDEHVPSDQEGRSTRVSSGRTGLRSVSAACAVLLGLTGAVLIGTAVTGPATPPRPDSPRSEPTRVESSAPPAAEEQAAPPRPSPARGTPRAVPDRIAGPTLPQSEPVRVTIPRIGVSSSLERLGNDAAGGMEVPQDAALAGWYALGPTPGALGPAVIAGHVTWDQAPAVFFRLGNLRRGDRVMVAREDGRRAVFQVTHVATYAKSRFPTRSVFGTIDHAGLRLITCGGTYDASQHRYLANVVVYARLLRTVTPG
jgi:hypothetical protein